MKRGRSREARAPSKRRLDALIGRRIAVPQELYGFHEDDDGFCFMATVTAVDRSNCKAEAKFDYTGVPLSHLARLVVGALSLLARSRCTRVRIVRPPASR